MRDICQIMLFNKQTVSNSIDIVFPIQAMDPSIKQLNQTFFCV